MTREEFWNTVDDFDSLLDFMHEIDYDNDILDDDQYDDYVNDDISECDCSWWVLKDYLDSLPESRRNTYYRRNASFDYDVLDDNDLENYKSDVSEFCDDWGFWDDPEDEDGDEDEDMPGDYDDESDPYFKSVPLDKLEDDELNVHTGVGAVSMLGMLF